MLPGGDANRLGDDVGRHRRAADRGAPPTRAGRERDREVAVEARVRRPQRPREAVVRALRDEVAPDLVADRRR